MIRTGRILLVEPEDDLRGDLRRRLEAAGHEVASVSDRAGAETLLGEGLAPDVVVSRSDRRPALSLSPDVVHVDTGDPEPVLPHGRADRRGTGAGAVSDLVRRVEEALLGHAGPAAAADDAWRSIDLARRLSNALAGIRSVEERIDLLVDMFQTYFGVRGTLVIRRGPAPDDWIEIGQDLDDDVVQRISDEIVRRSERRDIRPFLTRIVVVGAEHDVACMVVHRGERGTDLVIDLERAPAEPALREALMNLVGAALRSAARAERLVRAEARVEAEAPTFDALLERMSEFTGITHRGTLCERILASARRDLSMARASLFVMRERDGGMMTLQAVAGFSSVMLEGIGLSGFHGVGRMVLERGMACRLSELRCDGGAERERRMLAEASLQWAAPLAIGDRKLGLLLFGVKEGEQRLGDWEHRQLRALCGSAAVAMRNLEKLEALQGLAVGSMRSLAAAAELNRPADRGHAERVAGHAVRLARAAGMSPDEVRDVSFCGLLHDVGKVTYPADVADDAPEMRLHPVLATRILAASKPTPAVVHGVEQHHERWDGHGYPYGLRGAAIHPYGRIVAIANAWERLTAAAPDAPPDDALRRLELAAGILYDPALVAVFAGIARRGSLERSSPSRELSIDEIVGTEGG